MSLIKITDLSFAYEGSYDMVFDQVSFQIDTDWRLGFTGRNGRGKTTFLRLLSGALDSRGSIRASVAFDYFPFPVEDPERMSMEVVEGCVPEAESWRIYRELNLLRVEEQVLFRPFSTLSQGEQTKVLLAALFLRENYFLLIDEPTNHLDMEARAVVSNYLKGKKGFILVSHDRMFLDNCVDHILSINKTNLEIQQGNFSSWMQNKAYQDAFELARDEKLKKDIRRLSQSAKRTAGWSDEIEKSKFGEKVPDRGFIGHKAVKMMKRSKAVQERTEQALEEKKGLLQNLEKTEALKIHVLPHYARELIEVKELSLFYEARRICESVSFSVAQGERISLGGKNGAGKSSVLKAVLGEEIAREGLIRRAGGLVISYVPQDASFLKGELRIFAREQGIDESLFKTILRKLDFSRTQFEKRMEEFSAGQKKKVLLAASLSREAHLYLWDEPLNYIDIFSRMQLEELLLNSNPAMIFVEHDQDFVNKIATKTVML